MEKRVSGPGSSSYGQACMQCYKAKCRCVLRPNSDGCERCLRLKKQCQPSESARRRGVQNHETDAQIANLEGKIEALTSMLQSVVKATGVSADLPPSLAGSLTAVGMGPTPLRSASPTASAHSSPFQPGGLSELSPAPLHEPTSDEAEGFLELFRNRMLPYFPFMYISPNLTAQQLRRDRPFLFRAIVAVATPSTQQKVARIEKLKHMLTEAAVLENQSNIDILQSILTCIAWSTDPFLKRTSNMSRMMMLATTLVYDLQVAKPPLPEAGIIASMAPGLGDVDRRAGETSTQDFLEQQRAFLACFALSSIISTYFRRIDAMRWTPQMEECLRIIEVNKESHSDQALAFQVRLQILAQKVAQVREQQQAERARSMETTAVPPAPASLYLRALQRQLQDLKGSLYPHLQQLDMLTAHAHYVELCISEVTRLASSDSPLVVTSESASTIGGNVPGFEHLECLWQCLHAIKSWLDVFYTVSPTVYMGFPFFYWFQLVRCVVLLKHLSTFEDPAWDRQAVYKTVDIVRLLEWMAEKVEAASMEAGEQSNDDRFRQVSRMLRLSKGWVEAKRKAAAQRAEEAAYNEMPGFATAYEDMVDPNQRGWINALESGDQTWLEDFFGWFPGTL